MTKSKKVGVVIIAIMLSVAIFFGLMLFIETLTVPDEANWKEVCVAKSEIDRNTYITKDNVNDMFELKKIPDALKTSTTVTDLELLIGNSTVRDIVSNEIITSDKITYLAEMEYASKITEMLGNVQDFTEISVSIESLDGGLAGKVRRGDIVNIEIVKDNGKTGCLAENVYVSHVYDNAGVELIDDNYEGVASVMTVLISDRLRKIFVDGLSCGRPYISKMLNAPQTGYKQTVVYNIGNAMSLE